MPRSPRLLLTALVLLAAACASTPPPLRGEFADIPPSGASASGVGSDARLRWGGRIVEVRPEARRTCFELIGLALDRSGRPRAVDRSEGRFLACRDGFYDPGVFAAGREVSIVGRLSGFEPGRVGEFEYRYPVLQADAIYLWPERREPDIIVERAGWW